MPYWYWFGGRFDDHPMWGLREELTDEEYGICQAMVARRQYDQLECYLRLLGKFQSMQWRV